MKHSQVLKRAWKILWDYKALWIFGIILALTTASATSNNFNWRNDDDQRTYQSEGFDIDPDEAIWPQVMEQGGDEFEQAIEEFEQALDDDYQDKLEQNFVRAIIIFVVVMTTLTLVGTVLRYMAETSIITMVNDYEETGTKIKAREGFRLGWSRKSWKLFLMELLIEVPLTLIFLVLIGAALTPLLLWATNSPAKGMMGVITSIGLILLLVLAGIIIRVFLSLTKPFFRREIVLSELGVRASIRAGIQTVRRFWKESGLMWLIMKGIDMVWPIVMIPFLLVGGALGLLLGGGTAFLIGGEKIMSGDPAMVGSIVVGVVLFLLVVAVPLTFIGGVKETYRSTNWTLTFRELKALGSLENGDAAKLEAELGEVLEAEEPGADGEAS